MSHMIYPSEKQQNVINKEVTQFSLVNDLEDIAHECNAYMKIKNFMANRIIELEQEVEDLKNELNSQVMKNIQLNELFKTLNHSLNEMKIYSNNHQEKEFTTGSNMKRKNSCFNLSGELIDSVLIVENNENHSNNFYDLDNEKDNYSPIFNIKKHDTPINKKITPNGLPSPVIHSNLKFQNDKFLNDLKNQNIELSNQLEIIKNELFSKNIKINKLTTDKVIILNELNELLISLRRVDLKALNKFYKENASKNLRSTEVSSVLGVKYNILSAHAQLSAMIGKKSNLSTLVTNNLKYNTDNDNLLLPLEKYESIFKSYEEEFQKLLMKNLKRKKIFKKKE